ncbi:hypothetical protein EDB86DRAFT_3245932 [Lactarius hatsudake]|nr:hypothetical protein EDB86DRAFT_3245932 [Lactarius hatsudake]
MTTTKGSAMGTLFYCFQARAPSTAMTAMEPPTHIGLRSGALGRTKLCMPRRRRNRGEGAAATAPCVPTSDDYCNGGVGTSHQRSPLPHVPLKTTTTRATTEGNPHQSRPCAHPDDWQQRRGLRTGALASAGPHIPDDGDGDDTVFDGGLFRHLPWPHARSVTTVSISMGLPTTHSHRRRRQRHKLRQRALRTSSSSAHFNGATQKLTEIPEKMEIHAYSAFVNIEELDSIVTKERVEELDDDMEQARQRTDTRMQD